MFSSSPSHHVHSCRLDRMHRLIRLAVPCVGRHVAGPMRRLLLLAGLSPFLVVGAAASAQGTSAPGSVRTLVGDVALILKSDRPGTLRIAVAGPSRSLSLQVRATDARRWADSAALLLAPPRRSTRRSRSARSDRTVQRSRATLEEPGVGAGTLVLIRDDSASARQFLLFADDAALDGIRQPLELEQARLLVRLIRRAVTPPKKKPAPAKGAAR